MSVHRELFRQAAVVIVKEISKAIKYGTTICRWFCYHSNVLSLVWDHFTQRITFNVTGDSSNKLRRKRAAFAFSILKTLIGMLAYILSPKSNIMAIGNERNFAFVKLFFLSVCVWSLRLLLMVISN